MQSRLPGLPGRFSLSSLSTLPSSSCLHLGFFCPLSSSRGGENKHHHERRFCTTVFQKSDSILPYTSNFPFTYLPPSLFFPIHYPRSSPCSGISTFVTIDHAALCNRDCYQGTLKASLRKPPLHILDYLDCFNPWQSRFFNLIIRHPVSRDRGLQAVRVGRVGIEVTSNPWK